MPISPNQGSIAGSTGVTITGTNLTGAMAVHFGAAPAIAVTNVSPTQVTALSPSGTGVVAVTVTTPGGTSNPAPFFYVAPPLLTTVSPASGQFIGGNSVSLTGLNLATAIAVTFGANAGTITAADDSALTITVPTASGIGTVPLTVVTAGGTADGIAYTYVANPNLMAITPASGPISGGNLVTLTGVDLASTEEVVFGPNAVQVGGQNASFTVISETEIAVVAPPEAAGPADVLVKSPGGQSNLLAGYTYLAGPST
jgi:hypothetical protein